MNSSIKLFSKISNLSWINIWILLFKTFFFSAFFVVSGTQNVPVPVYDFAHHQYSHDECNKRRKQTTIDEGTAIIETPEESFLFEAIGSTPRKIFLKVPLFFQSFRTFSLSLNQTFKSSVADLFGQLHFRSYLMNGKLLI